jgi:hypothetical protein
MGRARPRWIALEVPAVLAALALGACLLVGGVVYLWSSVGGNIAGWVTTFVVFVVAFVVAELAGGSEVFSRASKRTQRMVIVAALLFAALGGGAYLLWPGTTSWYLSALPVIPILLVLDWLRGNDEPDPAQVADFTDGPWTAP